MRTDSHRLVRDGRSPSPGSWKAPVMTLTQAGGSQVLASLGQGRSPFSLAVSGPGDITTPGRHRDLIEVSSEGPKRLTHRRPLHGRPMARHRELGLELGELLDRDPGILPVGRI